MRCTAQEAQALFGSSGNLPEMSSSSSSSIYYFTRAIPTDCESFYRVP